MNPNRLDDKSNLNYLCAAGVSFMFLISLNKDLRSIQWFDKKKIKEPNLLNYLDLVSLGTVCDVVPLIGLNRALVKQGLKILKSKKNLGLKTLLEICKIETSPSIYHLGYVLGPRINAGGRVGRCSHGANLLLNKNPKETFDINIMGTLNLIDITKDIKKVKSIIIVTTDKGGATLTCTIFRKLFQD